MAAEAVVCMALDTLRDLVLEEARFLSGVRGEVKALEKQLKEMRCLLEDADKRRHESKTVGNWIREIKDLAYRAEDAIDTYALKVSSSRRGGRLKQLLRRFSCTLNDCFSLHQIGSEISQIKWELGRVTKSMQEYGIRSIIRGESGDESQSKRQTYPFEIEDCFVGKEDEVDHLVSLALDQEEHHRVISIWGMGGIGKTSIARKVYNHDEIKRSFESFAWICITQQCQIRSVWEDAVKQLNPQNRNEIGSLSNTELVGQLYQIQKAKRCLIVVDDVWEIDHWDGLKKAFHIQGLKSKILLTTRKRNIANVGFAFELRLLTVDDGWELLKKKATPHANIPESGLDENSFEKIGKEMVHKCGYLPLVVCILGGVLSKKKSLREWVMVKENIDTCLYNGENEEIHGVLNLSYEELPYYLKSCFLYLGLFKEDQEIYTPGLYRFWIAQGMISHENREAATLVEIAELYLGELASRSIVQVEVVDDNVLLGNKYRSCRLHDVVRELCLSMGKKEDFGVQIVDYQGGRFDTLLYESLSSVKTRHLAIHLEREIELERGEVTIIDACSKHVRSLHFLNDMRGRATEFPHALVDFQKFKVLKVLVFVSFNFAGRKLPRGIDSLIHLRNLRLEECDELDELPSSIGNLANLHSLDLSYTRNVRLPNSLRKLFRLRHLILPEYDEEDILRNYRLSLDEGLDNLETLIGFNSLVHELKTIVRMKNLQRFFASVYDNESLYAVVNAVTENLKNLKLCSIEILQGCQFTNSMEKGVMDLKKVLTCPKLFTLNLCVRVGRLLEECENEIITSNILTLTLAKCEIEDNLMEMLGMLPSLQQLLLHEGSYVGQEMTCHARGFTRLKWLELNGLPNLRQWRVEEGAMPAIFEITILNCPHLEMIPDGFKSTVTLNSLMIVGMPRLQKRVSKGGEDFHKVGHVPSIILISDFEEEDATA